MDSVFKPLLNNIKYLFLVAFSLNVLTAIFSIGFYHPDEQYYAIDYAARWLGLLPSSHFSGSGWEETAMIRPWTLPFILAHLMLPLKWIGITDPFILATWLRLISSLLALWAWTRFLKTIKASTTLIMLSLFSFFILFMNVRTSSDSWSTSSFLLALSFLLSDLAREKYKNLILGGLLFGLTFSLRHQTGILCLSFGLWLLFTSQNLQQVKKWFSIFVPSILVTVLLGILIDCLGHGKITITPWNYIYQNLLLNKVNSFGISPFWEYFRLTFLKLTPIIGLPLIFSLFYFIYKNPRHWVTHTFIPFFLIHSLIGHKEFRFIYPLAPLALYMLADTLSRFSLRIHNFFWGLNILAIIMLCFRPAYSPLSFYQFLWSQQDRIHKIFVEKDIKTGDFPQLEMKFYLPSNLQLIRGLSQTEEEISYYLWTTRYQERESKHCQIVFSQRPLWLRQFNLFHWIERSNWWMLYRCHKPSNNN